MRKRWIVLIGLVLCMLALAGCGKKKNGQAPESSPAGESSEESSEDLAGLLESVAQENGIDTDSIVGAAAEIAPEVELLTHVPVSYHENDLSFMFGSVSALLTQGIVVDTNTADFLKPGRMTRELRASYRDDEFRLRIVNLSKKDARIDNCFIAYCRFTGENTTFSNGFVCGKTTRDELEAYYGTPLYSDERQDVYKVTLSKNIDLSAAKDLAELFRNINKHSRDMILTFNSQGVLESVSFASLEYMFRNLAANLGYRALLYLLDTLTAEQDGFEEVAQLEANRDEVVAKFMEALARHGVEAYADSTTGEIRIGEDLLFENDRAELLAEAEELLDAISLAYAETAADPEIAGMISDIEIAGHASPEGTFEHNQELSERRAEAVRAYCLGCVPEEDASRMEPLLVAEGYSFRFPVFDENGEPDMEASRRVEISIHIKAE